MKIKAMGNNAAATISLIGLVLLCEWLIYINSVYQKGWGQRGRLGKGDYVIKGDKGDCVIKEEFIRLPITQSLMLFPLF
jgi:hypothetical protein